jgi:ATP/maltotriose-dependent transcriptional regulator MalT
VTGALVHLQFGLNMLAWVHVLRGELSTSAALLDEGRRIAVATGNAPIVSTELLIAAWRGQDQRANELIDAMTRQAAALGVRRFGDFAAYGRAVLYNGLGHHAEARDAARSAFAGDHAGFGPFVVPELVEAAARAGDPASLSSVLDWLAERTRATPSNWSLGIEARTRAFMSEGDAADGFYRESIALLRRTPVRVELARAHLLYGEWLRRQSRRVQAREQLRIAHEMLALMGLEAFAERARRELLATGERVTHRSVETRDDLTPQERQIAGLARDGLSNPEIGARLFLSPRTVEWHMRKVFAKLGIRSRRELTVVLRESASEFASA